MDITWRQCDCAGSFDERCQGRDEGILNIFELGVPCYGINLAIKLVVEDTALQVSFGRKFSWHD